MPRPKLRRRHHKAASTHGGRCRPITTPKIQNRKVCLLYKIDHHILQPVTSSSSVWKPLKTITNWPLAVCDSATVQHEDLISTDLVRRKYIGETFYSTFNPDHRWYYLSNQRPNEVTMLKIHDSYEAATVRCENALSFRCRVVAYTRWLRLPPLVVSSRWC